MKAHTVTANKVQDKSEDRIKVTPQKCTLMLKNDQKKVFSWGVKWALVMGKMSNGVPLNEVRPLQLRWRCQRSHLMPQLITGGCPTSLAGILSSFRVLMHQPWGCWTRLYLIESFRNSKTTGDKVRSIKNFDETKDSQRTHKQTWLVLHHRANRWSYRKVTQASVQDNLRNCIKGKSWWEEIRGLESWTLWETDCEINRGKTQT